MKKIIIPTLLTLTVAPLATIVSCGDQPTPPEPATDTREWDYSNGYLCEARQYPLEGLQAERHYMAISSYLSAAKANPKGFVDDLFLAENYNYLEYYSYLGSELKKYKVKFTVSDVNEIQNSASVHVEKEVRIQNGDGPITDITIDLAINKMRYYSVYSIGKERLTGAAIGEWSFYPEYKRTSFAEFVEEMKMLYTGWSINGKIQLATDGVVYDSIVYDNWNRETIEGVGVTEKQYHDLLDSFSAVGFSYYFSYLPINGDNVFNAELEQGNTYWCQAGPFADESREKVFVFRPSEYEDFASGTYELTLLDQQTIPVSEEYIVMNHDDKYVIGWTKPDGRFQHPISLNKNSCLIFKLSGAISCENLYLYLTKIQ